MGKFDGDTENWETECVAFETNEKWKSIVGFYLEKSGSFEIRCFNEEQNEIGLLQRFAGEEPQRFEYETVIKGEVTKEFIAFLLSLPKPEDTEIYNKMTPFFTVILDCGFSSEHYGTELYLTRPQQYKLK